MFQCSSLAIIAVPPGLVLTGLWTATTWLSFPLFCLFCFLFLILLLCPMMLDCKIPGAFALLCLEFIMRGGSYVIMMKGVAWRGLGFGHSCLRMIELSL